MNFISNPNELKERVNDIIAHPDDYKHNSEELQKFIIQKDKEFFEKLNILINYRFIQLLLAAGEHRLTPLGTHFGKLL